MFGRFCSMNTYTHSLYFHIGCEMPIGILWIYSMLIYQTNALCIWPSHWDHQAERSEPQFHELEFTDSSNRCIAKWTTFCILKKTSGFNTTSLFTRWKHLKIRLLFMLVTENSHLKSHHFRWPASKKRISIAQNHSMSVILRVNYKFTIANKGTFSAFLSIQLNLLEIDLKFTELIDMPK